MEDKSTRKKILYKICIDPLPFLEYFVQGDDAIYMAKILIPVGEMKEYLQTHTVNRDYAYSIAKKVGYLNYKPSNAPIDLGEVDHLLSQPMSEKCLSYLDGRKFPTELIKDYKLSSWRHYEQHPYSSIGYYFPFNAEALDYCTSKMNLTLGPDNPHVNMREQDMLVMPSYDRLGNLNNLAFRFVDDYISSFWAKWLFSHGRQATFGAHKIDESKPVYVVEGFFDHVACDQMGIQSVGLGSAFISDAHWEQLKGLDVTFVLDSDEAGVNHAQRLREDGHKVKILKDLYKDPYDYWVNNKDLEFL